MDGDLRRAETGLAANQQVCFTISRPAPSSTLDPRPSTLTLSVDISLVREILPDRRITPVPLAPETTPGIFDWRGRIVPVVDLAEVLGYGRGPRSGSARLLVLEIAAGPMALLVSQVTGIVRTVGRVSPVPAGVDLDPALARGAIDSPYGPAILLDPEAIPSRVAAARNDLC